MKRVVFVGTHPGHSTGYAKVNAGLIDYVRQQGVECSVRLYVYAIQTPKSPVRTFELTACETEEDGGLIEIHDATSDADCDQWGFGMPNLARYVKRVRPDWVWISNDLYVLSHMVKQLREANVDCRIALYVDMFYPNFYHHYLDTLNSVDKIVTFAGSWRNVLTNMGVRRHIDVLHHSFNRETFYPLDKHQCRRDLGLPTDAFLVLNFNRNLLRKRLDVFMMAMARVIVASPQRNIVCLVNCHMDYGFEIYDILAHELRDLGCTATDIDFITKTRIRLLVSSVDDATVNKIYNACDIGVNTSEGEGWSLCPFEHAGVGKPQVVSAVGPLPDLFDDSCACIIQPSAYYYLDLPSRDKIGGKAAIVSASDVSAAILSYIRDDTKLSNHGRQCLQRITNSDAYSPLTIGAKFCQLFD